MPGNRRRGGVFGPVPREAMAAEGRWPATRYGTRVDGPGLWKKSKLSLARSPKCTPPSLSRSASGSILKKRTFVFARSMKLTMRWNWNQRRRRSRSHRQPYRADLCWRRSSNRLRHLCRDPRPGPPGLDPAGPGHGRWRSARRRRRHRRQQASEQESIEGHEGQAPGIDQAEREAASAGKTGEATRRRLHGVRGPSPIARAAPDGPGHHPGEPSASSV